MTLGQLFTVMNPEVVVRKNGTCIWLYFDDVNYYTIGTEWWDKEIPDNTIAVLKNQAPVKPDYMPATLEWSCGNCGQSFDRCKYKYCPYCGRAVKWDD